MSVFYMCVECRTKHEEAGVCKRCKQTLKKLYGVPFTNLKSVK